MIVHPQMIYTLVICLVLCVISMIGVMMRRHLLFWLVSTILMNLAIFLALLSAGIFKTSTEGLMNLFLVITVFFMQGLVTLILMSILPKQNLNIDDLGNPLFKPRRSRAKRMNSE